MEERAPIPCLVVWNDASEQAGEFTYDLLANKGKTYQYVGFLVDFDDTHATFVSHVDGGALHNRFDLPWAMVESLTELHEGEELFND